MIYQEILNDGRGYGKPHVVWVGAHGCWKARYRGCFSLDYKDPYKAAMAVCAFYKSHYPNEGVE